MVEKLNSQKDENMTATLEAPQSTSSDAWNEACAKYHHLDAAIRRKAAMQQTADDEFVLASSDVTGLRLQDEITRLKGVELRKQKAGDPKSFAAAQKKLADATTADESTRSRLSPQIAQLQQQLRDLQAELQAVVNSKKACADTFDGMVLNRRILETLLPSGIKSAIVAAERPIRAKWQPALAAADYEKSLANSQSSVDGKMARIEAAETKLKDVQSRMNAELEAVAREQRDFYFDA